MSKFINFFLVFMTLILAGLADPGASAQASDSRSTRNTGTLMVDNHRQEIVVLFVDERFEAMVAGGEHRRISLPEGRHEVELRQLSGKSLSQSRVQLRRGRTATVRVPALDTRTVRLTNRVRKDVTVYVDGQRMARVEAGHSGRLELSIGTHYILVVDSQGRVLEDSVLRVAMYSNADIVVQEPRREHERVSTRHRSSRQDVQGYVHAQGGYHH